MTTSEEIFEEYCRIQKYICTKIPEGSKRGKTPDWTITVKNQKIIVEVKELTPNPDDKQRAADMVNKGCSSGNESVGRRIQSKVSKATDQLGKYKNCGIPLVLVLYDNIIVNGQRPYIRNKHFDPVYIDSAMYGLQTVKLKKDTLEHLSDERGGNKLRTLEEKKYISAISIIDKDENNKPFIASYHNYFATIPLPLTVFAGQKDKHFKKPANPNKNFQHWAEMKEHLPRA